MSILRKLLLVCCALTLVVACGSGPKPIADELKPIASPVSETPSYKIGPGDVVNIKVWKNPNLSVEVPVRPDGYVSVPLIGDVLASGESPEDVARTVESRLAQYIRSPKATVIVSDLVSHEFLSRVRVVGAVAAPKSIGFRQGMTVLDLVLEAGGVNEFAEPDRAFLHRKTTEGVKSYPIYLEQILNKGQLESNYALEPGDVVSIPERRF
ncbi:MAG TPA: sugar ABC transporter substrate-binding protein [Gammaproteobacteria bacterium]|jgi:polysaccharide export outer membrane protein|nr:sugar ABC transporter substrate-binding protein [Gammaproteobacteria bacterium]